MNEEQLLKVIKGMMVSAKDFNNQLLAAKSAIEKSCSNEAFPLPNFEALLLEKPAHRQENVKTFHQNIVLPYPVPVTLLGNKLLLPASVAEAYRQQHGAMMLASFWADGKKRRVELLWHHLLEVAFRKNVQSFTPYDAIAFMDEMNLVDLPAAFIPYIKGGYIMASGRSIEIIPGTEYQGVKI